MTQTLRHLAVLTDFVPLKWHDLARHIARHCGNKSRASVRLALDQITYIQKYKSKGLDTCYSATYMSQTRDQQRFYNLRSGS